MLIAFLSFNTPWIPYFPAFYDVGEPGIPPLPLASHIGYLEEGVLFFAN